ncbi:hypothetical protein LOK49_Contig628G00002 [Camellia lanceoleosa]|nr:hypothetical protein LOK49_Contig628G00002 [Camellia lanceoleosa]
MSVEGETGSHGRSAEETNHLNRSKKKIKGSTEIEDDNVGENNVGHEEINMDCAEPKASNTVEDAMVDIPDKGITTITEANRKDSPIFLSNEEDGSDEEAEEENMKEFEDLQCQIPKIQVPASLLKKARKPWEKCLIVRLLETSVSTQDPSSEAARRVYIGNIPRTVNNDELRQIVEEHGAVEKAEVMYDKYSGRSRFAFITMKTVEDANAAVEKLNGTQIGGPHKVYVGNLAKTVTTELLKNFFAEKGKVLSAKVSRVPGTSKSSGFGFVTFSSEEDVEAVISSVNNALLEGQKIRHRLKKSHYTSTDISSTVERIMYPEVPIALRMSGHLLLGVVRIYSKKVDYLYQDYNFFLITIRKAFAPVEVNLPEDATHAPFDSVTLPNTFKLDALNLDDDFSYDGAQDNHLRSEEEITLTCDQIPIGRDPYIAITFDEGILRDSIGLKDAPVSGASPMKEDHRPSLPVDPTVGFQDPGPEETEMVNEDCFPENIPEIEQQIINEKEILPPAAEEILVSGGQSLPSQQHGEPVSSASSDKAPDVFDSHVSFGHASPELAMRSTPPVGQPKARPRKRKQLYDESTVLTNKFMKAALDNCSDLLRRGNVALLLLWMFGSQIID